MQRTAFNVEAVRMVPTNITRPQRQSSFTLMNKDYDFDGVDEEENPKPLYMIVDMPRSSWRRRLLSDVAIQRNMDAVLLANTDEQVKRQADPSRERKASETRPMSKLQSRVNQHVNPAKILIKNNRANVQLNTHVQSKKHIL